ncbi:Cytosolic Fe-S cluster assembly factor nar1 [Zalaria obscura]|uniref:Cytosolic Fe-S cluster assembly factor nar1 n=1 Tax=Zalaria obscura TaxID=2024903 RepID=A0ACC3S581_9PEZI
MSAILSADDLNDFISPGVACIKPVETLPNQQPSAGDSSNPYEVTTEDKVAAADAPPASISLTDCLACSGCVTSAEAVLVSLQSHAEVLNTLDAYPELQLPWMKEHGANGLNNGNEVNGAHIDGKIFVASVSPQTKASIAATYGISLRQADNMINQLLTGPQGLRSGGQHRSGFTWVLDTNAMREAGLVAAADEVIGSLSPQETQSSDSTGSRMEKPKQPVLASACPGWICYAEKTHPHVLPHVSRLKSPQALTGTLLKSVLAKQYGISPDQVWHLAVMPCFDKKLEASRAELTDVFWETADGDETRKGIRDVDCVITARELLMLADARGISFPALSRKPLRRRDRVPFPDAQLDRFLFPPQRLLEARSNGMPEAGSSGGYLWHIMQTYRAQHPGSELRIQRGRNADVVEYMLVDLSTEAVIVKSARYYGFRNIQNLVRRLKPAKQSRMPGAASRIRPGAGARKPGGPAGSAAGQNMSEYVYVEVMACPGGCTNGGGQIKVGDVGALRGSGVENGGDQEVLPAQKEWLQRVDEAYYSAESEQSADDDEDGDDDVDMDGETNGNGNGNGDVGDEETVDGISRSHIKGLFQHWAESTGIDLDRLLYTSYRKVESDVGKSTGDVERVAGLASTIGGGW